MGNMDAAESGKKPPGNGYSKQMAFIYVFNMIIGTGVLVLPKAFAEVGWVLGLLVLTLLAFLSYVTVTFTIEAMSIANALVRCKTESKTPNRKGKLELECCYGDAQLVQNRNVDDQGDAREPTNSVTGHDGEIPKNICGIDAVEKHVSRNSSESGEKDDSGKAEKESAVVDKPTYNTTLGKDNTIISKDYRTCEHNIYDFTVTYEMGEMAKLLFHKLGVPVYYIIICLYIYGSQSIFATAISKSLAMVICGDKSDFGANITAPCTTVPSLSVQDMYHISLTAFVLLICPFAYFEISNTKLLQVFTTTYRWFSMIAMIVLALVRIAKGEGKSSTKLFVLDKLPHFLGVSVYAFMWHIVVPGVLTPVTDKRRVNLVVFLDYICVFLFYVTILMSAVYAFSTEDILDIYILNFVHPIPLKYVLQLYPVLSLSADFPLGAIVLRENIKKVVLNSEKEYNFFVRRIIIPTVAIIPPIAVAYSTCNVGMLMSSFGAYTGAIIQYVIPAMLVYCGRRTMTKIVGVYENVHQSPFRHRFWIALVMIWYIVCLVFVTYNKIKGI